MTRPGPANMDNCDPKCRCRGGRYAGWAYACADPCNDGTFDNWDEATCDCTFTEPCGGGGTNAGGKGVTINAFNVGVGAGTVQFSYDALTVPDSFTLTGAVNYSTGMVSGKRTIYLPKPEGPYRVVVTVVGGSNSTGWSYSISCAE